jgi:hypothetical protein
MSMAARRKFHAFLKAWKNSHRQRGCGGMGKWERKIRANPYRLYPEELLALRRAKFPLSNFDTRWIDQYLKLYAYTRRHGHSMVPARADGSLGRWVASQRKFRRRGRLSPQRQVALNQLRFCWDIKESFWQARISELARFIKKYGHMRVPDRPPHRRLVIWIDNVRQRRHSLISKHENDLQALEFVWTAIKDLST